MDSRLRTIARDFCFEFSTWGFKGGDHVSCLSEIVKRGIAMPNKPGRCSREGSCLFLQLIDDWEASPWSVIISSADDGDEVLLVSTSIRVATS
jgi:hypothetical protein